VRALLRTPYKTQPCSATLIIEPGLKFVHECIDDFPQFTGVFVLKWETDQIVGGVYNLLQSERKRTIFSLLFHFNQFVHVSSMKLVFN
jgi:hypothetical protein